MTPAEIQFELKKRKITQVEIANRENVHPVCISRVISRLMVSDRIMRAISAAISEDHRLVFPDYYLRPARRSTSKVSLDN